MSFVAEFSVTHPSLLLGTVIEGLPDANLRIPFSTTRASERPETAFLVVRFDDDWSRVDALLTDDETVVSHEQILGLSDEAVFCFDWETGRTNIWEVAASQDVFIDDFRAVDGQWYARVICRSRPMVGTIRQRAEEVGYSCELTSIRALTDDTNRSPTTDAQLRLVKTAYEEGYFRVPREISQAELARRFDITESAVSQQIRRGLQNILRDAIPSAEQSESVRSRTKDRR